MDAWVPGSGGAPRCSLNQVIHVFSGPSLPPSVRPALDGFVFHGPASQGDVYRVAQERPLAIGLIDGYFEHVPAVWHKELLWAMSEGVHVFGASSIGALRAAELADFGAVGVGRVFDAFRSNRLRDDDEVAIIHASEDDDYRPVADAMVNIRETLDKGVRENAISKEAAAALQDHAKSLFYPDRSFAELWRWAARGLEPAAAEAAQRFLGAPHSRVDVKREDALELLRVLVAFRDDRPGAKQVSWSFHHTDAWELVRRQATVAALGRAAAPLTSTISEEALRRAEQRCLQLEHARSDGFDPSADELAATVAEICAKRGFESTAELVEWAATKGWDEPYLAELIAEESCIRRTRLLMTQQSRVAVARHIEACELLGVAVE